MGRNQLDGSRKKGGIEVRAMIDAFGGVAEYVRMTEARVHDPQFLYHLGLPANSFIVFDKVYNLYRQFDKWTKQKIWLVTRMKENAVFHMIKVLVDDGKKAKSIGVIKEQLITIGYKNTDGSETRLKLRRIKFKGKDEKLHVFLTNNFLLPSSQIALTYKYRWMIELLFKQIKQNFPLRYFWGESENAIKMQVYCLLIAQLLMVFIRKKAATKKSFANMITVIRLHLMSYFGLLEFIKDTYKALRKSEEIPNALIPMKTQAATPGCETKKFY